MLRAYFDRSELPKYGIAVVAGYLSHVDLWDRFEPDWRKILRLEGLEFFHMADYVARQGPYKGWSDRRRLKVIKQLISVIDHVSLYHFATGLRTTDLDALIPKKQQHRELPPYGLCAICAAAGIMAWVRDRGSPSPIACVFESGDEHGGQIVDAFSSAKRKSDELDRRLLSWSFEDKRKIWGLQAADLLAYEAARQAVLNLGLRDHPVRQSLLRLLRRTRYDSNFLSIDALRKILFENGPSGDAI